MRNGQLVTHFLPCAAITNGCHSQFLWEDRSAAEEPDEAARRLLTLNGWWVDHGKWVCGQHPARAERRRGQATGMPETIGMLGRPGTIPFQVWRPGDSLKHLSQPNSHPIWSPLFGTRCGLDRSVGEWQNCVDEDDEWCSPCLDHAGIAHEVTPQPRTGDDPMSEHRFTLTIHPDDALLWLQMTGRDETRPYDMPPLKTLEGLNGMLDSAQRNGVRVLSYGPLDGKETIR